MTTQEQNINKTIGQRIKKMRILKGLTQMNVAKDLGVTFQQYQKYESGKNRISIEILAKISQALGVKCDFFFNDVEWEKINNFGK